MYDSTVSTVSTVQRKIVPTSIVVLINSLEPANVIVGVRDHVDIDSVVYLQNTSWTDLAPPRPIHTGSSLAG